MLTAELPQPDDGPCSPAVQLVEAALRATVAAPVVGGCAAADVLRLLAVQALLTAAVTERLAVLQAERSYTLDGSVTLAAWLRRNAELSPYDAAALVRLSRRLPELELVHAALCSGQISAEHAQVLASQLDRLDPEQVAVQQGNFLAAALLTDPRTLEVELRKRVQALQPLPADRDAQHLAEQRRFQLRQTYEGLWHLSGLLDPEGGAVVAAALGALRHTDHSSGDLRSAAQRDADALITLARSALDTGELPRSYGARPHLLITCPLDALRDTTRTPQSGPAQSGPAQTGPAQTGTAQTGTAQPGAPRAGAPEAGRPLAEHTMTGQPIRPRTLAALACDAVLTRLVLDPAGRVLDVGRSQRTVPEAVHLALIATHPSCWAQGCTEPVARTEAHHAQPWSEGGDTSYANSALLCLRRGGHHDQIHTGTHVQLFDGRRLGPHGWLPPPDNRPPGNGPAGAGPPGAGPLGAGPPGIGPLGAGPLGAGPPGAGPPGNGPPRAGPPGNGDPSDDSPGSGDPPGRIFPATG